MLNEQQIEETIGKIEDDLPGFLAASLVDLDSGMTLGARSADGEFDLATASAFESEMLKQKLKLMHALGLDAAFEDMLVTLSDQIHLIRLVSPTTFLFLAAHKNRANLAMVRAAVQRHADQLAA